MKIYSLKRILFVLLVTITCLIFYPSTALLTDYRDNYVGNYICHRNCKLFNGETIYSDTLTINISKSLVDSILQINIGTTSFQLKLINSSLQSSLMDKHCGGKFFATDSISFITSTKSKLCSYIGYKE